MDRRLSTGGSSPAWGPSILLPRGAVLPYFLQSHPSQTQVFLSVMFFLASARWSFVRNFSCISWDSLYQCICCLSIYKEYGEREGKAPPNVLRYLCSGYCLCTPVGSGSAFTASILAKSEPESLLMCQMCVLPSTKLPYQRREMTQALGLSL